MPASKHTTYVGFFLPVALAEKFREATPKRGDKIAFIIQAIRREFESRGIEWIEEYNPNPAGNPNLQDNPTLRSKDY